MYMQVISTKMYQMLLKHTKKSYAYKELNNEINLILLGIELQAVKSKLDLWWKKIFVKYGKAQKYFEDWDILEFVRRK